MFAFSALLPHLNIQLQHAKQHITESLDRTKQVFDRLFPAAASADVDYEQWLDQLAAHIEQKQRETIAVVVNSNNHINHTSQPSHKSTATNHVNHKSNSTQSIEQQPPPSVKQPKHGDDLILENAKLQATVEQYKTIVADTVSNTIIHLITEFKLKRVYFFVSMTQDKVLNWLEAKVREQELQLATPNGNAV